MLCPLRIILTMSVDKFGRHITKRNTIDPAILGENILEDIEKKIVENFTEDVKYIENKIIQDFQTNVEIKFNNLESNVKGLNKRLDESGETMQSFEKKIKLYQGEFSDKISNQILESKKKADFDDLKNLEDKLRMEIKSLNEKQNEIQRDDDLKKIEAELISEVKSLKTAYMQRQNKVDGINSHLNAIEDKLKNDVKYLNDKIQSLAEEDLNLNEIKSNISGLKLNFGDMMTTVKGLEGEMASELTSVKKNINTILKDFHEYEDKAVIITVSIEDDIERLDKKLEAMFNYLKIKIGELKLHK